MNETNEILQTSLRVKLIGVLGSAAGRREVDLQFNGPVTVSELVSALLKNIDNRQFQEFLVDSGTHDPRPNVIILLNEQDCNLYSGLKTRIQNDSLVTIIPVAHGG